MDITPDARSSYLGQAGIGGKIRELGFLDEGSGEEK